MNATDLPEKKSNPKPDEKPEGEQGAVAQPGATESQPEGADESQSTPSSSEGLGEPNPPMPSDDAVQPEFIYRTEGQAEADNQSPQATDNQEAAASSSDAVEPIPEPEAETAAEVNLAPAEAASSQPEAYTSAESQESAVPPFLEGMALSSESYLQAENQAESNPELAETTASRSEQPTTQYESRPVSSRERATRKGQASAEKEVNPASRLRAVEAAAKKAPAAKIPLRYRLRPNGELTRRAYWDVASALSLIVNIILIAVLFILAAQVRSLKTTVSGLLGGLYSNLAEMDKTSISTTASAKADIPVSFDVPIQTSTDVTLAEAVSVPDASVMLNGTYIPTSIILPAGTVLPITLDISVPVKMTVPVDLQIPVNIPLNQTNLLAPLTGLQTTLRQMYCAFDKGAQDPEGVSICSEKAIP